MDQITPLSIRLNSNFCGILRNQIFSISLKVSLRRIPKTLVNGSIIAETTWLPKEAHKKSASIDKFWPVGFTKSFIF